MPARMTPLTAGIPTINFDQSTPVPRSFVFQLADELPPADIVNGLRQRGVFRHRLHAQTLDADRLVLTNDAGREFVGEIAATVGNAGVNTRYLSAGLITILRAELFLAQAPLGFSQPLFIRLKEAWVAY